MRSWVLVLIVVLSFHPAHADCPDVAQGKYPGWAERFSGELSTANSTSIGDFDITLTSVFTSTAIQVNVLKDKSQYVRASVVTGREGNLKKPDILLELNNASGSKANVTIYTPRRANLTANVTNIEFVTTEGVLIALLPSEEFQVDFLINNTGELEARDIHITPKFGDFEILQTDAKDTQYICPGSVQDFKYVLKTPNVRKAFNYTMYLELGYTDENIETGETGHRVTYYPFEVEIVPALVEISRSSTNWTLNNPGRKVSVRVTINNTGDKNAYNVEWGANIPPYVQVGGGTASFRGDILEGKMKIFNYNLVSDDPLKCTAISSVTYKDRVGNNYTSFSDNETLRFSPFITVDKRIGRLSWYIDPTKNILRGTTTWAVDEDVWWDSGSAGAYIDDPAKISFNRSRNLSISVRIKNMGNAVARGLSVNEILKGVKSDGTTSWEGELIPDEEVSYSYTVDVLQHGNISLGTNVTYLDVDPNSFKPPLEDVGGRPQFRYCTVTLKNVEFETRDEFYALYPSVVVEQSSDLKVLGGSEFDFNAFVSNNGSDAVHDVLVNIDTTDLRSQIKYGGEILKGQSFYYLENLRAEYYPDGTSRGLSDTNISYGLVLRAPDVDIKSNFTITTTVNYTDFNGEVHSKNVTSNITVVKAIPAYEVVTIEKKNLSVTSGSPGELDIDDYGDAYIKIKNTGYADLENITIKTTIPLGLEVYSNDTAWHGRIEAELRRLNDTWYGFTGDISWNGSLTSGEERTLPLLIRGKKAGLYDISSTLNFNEHQLSGTIPVKVKGAILNISKSLSAPTINVTGDTEVTVSIENIGEASAEYLIIVDHPPLNFDVIGETEAGLDELKPGEKTALKYTLVPQKEGSYTLRKASVEWTDRLGNEYEEKSGAPKLEVTKAPEPTVQPPVEEVQKLSKKQIIVTVLFSLVLLGIMFKFLLMSTPISKE